jgi:hypothetical protein
MVGNDQGTLMAGIHGGLACNWQYPKHEERDSTNRESGGDHKVLCAYCGWGPDGVSDESPRGVPPPLNLENKT